MLEFWSMDYPFGQGFFCIPRRIGHYVGIWPEAVRPCYYNLLAAFAAFVIGLGGISELIYGFINYKNLVTFLEGTCPGSAKFFTLLKLLIFLIYTKQYHGLVQRLREMLMPAVRDHKMLQSLAFIGNAFGFVMICTGTVTTFAFTMQPILRNAYRAAHDLPPHYKLPFSVPVPNFAAHNPLHVVLFVLFSASGMCTAIVFTCVDGYFLCCCLYICGAFRILQEDIRRIFVDLHEFEQFSAAQNAMIKAQLSDIVERHNLIIDFCSDLASQFTFMILMHFLLVAFVLCAAILDLMLNSGSPDGLMYITFAFASLTEHFMLCFGGEFVNTSSGAVADTIYDVEWYKCDLKTRKMVLMILCRAQKNITITVPFFTPSLTAFTALLSTTVSYITLLNTFL